MDDLIPSVDEQLAGNPAYDRTARSTRSKLFLATFEFNVGTYGVPVHHTISARDIESAEKKISRYLNTFYGPKHQSNWERHGDTWSYHLGDVIVDLHSVEEVTAEEVIRRIRIL